MAEIAPLRPEPIGDTAVTVRVTGSSAADTLGKVRRVAKAVRAAAIPGVTDVVAAPGRVTVAYDPLLVTDPEALSDAVAAAGGAAAAAAAGSGGSLVHEIPVAYDGPDLDEVCGLKGIGRDAFVAAHTEPEYLVEALGFLPGFGYLSGLPARLATPRRATPRRLVPAGSVGIGGGQTGAYPLASPGGWNLVGRTDAPLFDAGRARPALLSVGDRVRFVAAELPPVAARAAPPTVAGPAAITVVHPGLFTTVQDLGRPGHRAAGLPCSGGADRVSLRLANLLVGNAEDAAAIECTLVGPTLEFQRAAVVALVGAVFPGFPAGLAVRVAAGTQFSLGHTTAGCRGYLAVAGGIDVPVVLGSRSTLVNAGLGGLDGRPLRAGDRLAVGDASVRICSATGPPCSLPVSEEPAVLRIIPGDHEETFGRGTWSRTFRASSRSDRMGLRLEGEAVPGAEAGGSMVSVPVFPGTVQVPPDGQPIVLLADAQTIGGYPVLGQVIVADLPRAAQLRPGDEVRLAAVSIAEARAALREQEAALAAVREGL